MYRNMLSKMQNSFDSSFLSVKVDLIQMVENCIMNVL